MSTKYEIPDNEEWRNVFYEFHRDNKDNKDESDKKDKESVEDIKEDNDVPEINVPKFMNKKLFYLLKEEYEKYISYILF